MKTVEEILLKYTNLKTVKNLIRKKEDKYVRISTALEAMIEYSQQQVENNAVLSDVRSSLPDDLFHFAEWMDIVCIRNGRFEWKYNKDNYTKVHTTKEMYKEWLTLTGTDS